MDQNKTPFLCALIDLVDSKPTSFDVPSHKLNYTNDLIEFLKSKLYMLDQNGAIGLDHLYNSDSVIKESEELAAELFSADNCYFLVNGTTIGIIASLYSTLKENDKVILPRNVHKSIINAIILTGATPLFINPYIDPDLDIAVGVKIEDYIKTIDENLDAKAVIIINPTYYGTTINIKEVIDYAHEKNMIAIVDEAHGSNFNFSDLLPKSAMSINADISITSLHKNSGSLTQSSLLLTKGNRVSDNKIKQSLSMLTTTSPSNLLLASIDASRKKLYLDGKQMINDLINLSNYARKKINEIGVIHTWGKEFINRINNSSVFDMDLTKIVIDVSNLDITGFDLYYLLKKDYNIQIELGDENIILVILTFGCTKEDIDKLIFALSDIVKKHKSNVKRKVKTNNKSAKLILNPKVAFNSNTEEIEILKSLNRISAEIVTTYPPGIPLLIPGEKINKEIIDILKHYKENNVQIIKDSKDNLIKVVK